MQSERRKWVEKFDRAAVDRRLGAGFVELCPSFARLRFCSLFLRLFVGWVVLSLVRLLTGHYGSLSAIYGAINMSLSVDEWQCAITPANGLLAVPVLLSKYTCWFRSCKATDDRFSNALSRSRIT